MKIIVKMPENAENQCGRWFAPDRLVYAFFPTSSGRLLFRLYGLYVLPV